MKIQQGRTAHTWSDISFGDFSDWQEDFSVGMSTIVVTDNSGKILAKVDRQLPPGPLVVALKGTWPLNFDTGVEAIAASYVSPPAGSSGVRLFNLSPNTVMAGLTRDGQTVANGVSFCTGSDWTPMDTSTKPFEIDDFDAATGTGTPLLTQSWTPPEGASTVFLLGAQNSSSTEWGPRWLNLTDAPHL